MENFEYRMYGLVAGNISPIQQGIQFGHAVVEYGLKYAGNDDYKKWANEDKTFIILNGGTTNARVSLNDGLPVGSLNKHLLTLNERRIKFATFYEPDLGDQLTAIVFLVDERVFNKVKYPDFIPEENYLNDMVSGNWLKNIGEKNLFLRNFLSEFRLA
jgi:hypothetical protein